MDRIARVNACNRLMNSLSQQLFNVASEYGHIFPVVERNNQAGLVRELHKTTIQQQIEYSLLLIVKFDSIVKSFRVDNQEEFGKYNITIQYPSPEELNKRLKLAHNMFWAFEMVIHNGDSKEYQHPSSLLFMSKNEEFDRWVINLICKPQLEVTDWTNESVIAALKRKDEITKKIEELNREKGQLYHDLSPFLGHEN